MALPKLSFKQTIDTGLTVKWDRTHKFRIGRKKDDLGFHVYYLENLIRSERLCIRRFIFDRFRAVIRNIVAADATAKAPQRVDEDIVFKGETLFTFQSPATALHSVVIEQNEAMEGGPWRMEIDRAALPVLDGLLFDARLVHPNDVLNRIIAYHKLFQFSFVESSDSITSNLQLRKDILMQRVPYIPALGKRVGQADRQMDPDLLKIKSKKLSPEDEGDKADENEMVFKSRLAARAAEKSYDVDYSLLFGRGHVPVASQDARANREERMAKSRGRLAFPLPIMASELKAFASPHFRCELTQDESKDLREEFLHDREAEFFLGFEIMDAVYKNGSGRLQSFRFPLYYLPVTLKESGRQLFIETLEDGRMYLNHLALANLVETFSKDANPEAGVNRFFRNLLAQKIEVDGQLSRIYLSRFLPVNEAVFDRSRDVLIGLPGESGRGGILTDLRIIGVECDTESTILYKSPKMTAPLKAALEHDLANIAALARETPERFYSSLLGRFLSPETNLWQDHGQETFCTTPLMPEALAKSTKRLIRKLNESDLILLEGPPGTGKTHTIMNLFIHALTTGKRLLIVSDKQAAIHALTEKLTDYLVGRDRESPHAKNMEALWRAAVKVVDQVPEPTHTLAHWARDLAIMLGVDNPKEIGWPGFPAERYRDLASIDGEMVQLVQSLERLVMEKLAGKGNRRVSPKHMHATTEQEIAQLVAFLTFLGVNQTESPEPRGVKARYLMYRFIRDREYLARENLAGIYKMMSVPEAISADDVKRFVNAESLLNHLLKKSPKSIPAFMRAMQGAELNELSLFLKREWERHFPPGEHAVKKAWRFLTALFRHPLRRRVSDLQKIMVDFKNLLKLGNTVDASVWQLLGNMHRHLAPGTRQAVPLSLEICRFAAESFFAHDSEDKARRQQASAQELLERIERLQAKRDAVVRELFVGRLGAIANASQKADEAGGTSPLTSLSVLLEALKNHSSLESARGDLHDLQQKLLATFPVWICRKQAVSFLFGCDEKMFDLVVVDEATQCRVDDALPLLFRAKKLLVVGDDKQTVLAKNSIVDDYLFAEFNMDEHLRSTQARGIKGGGSHIFGLVKAIKQASVMLDEHYRCPPDIIQYSNHYVYSDELKTMQWLSKDAKPAVVIDYSESGASATGRRDNGQFKGIETDMVDRFLKYVARTVQELERETGRRIDMEQDVALCYFLLKNEPYVKAVKGEFLQKLGRGNDVLDGAGAALQGKERDYIFYFWDVTRANMMAFRMGDDPDKRKGELNVLMSRPKKRAFHFLHKDFRHLDHQRATITDYLWRSYQRQGEKAQKASLTPRRQAPGPSFVPWRRSSGQLMLSILKGVMGHELPRSYREGDLAQFGVVVGDPKQRVDLVLLPDQKSMRSYVGLVDLSGFDAQAGVGQEIVDYYFQLQRAKPKVVPVFLFMHELAEPDSRGFQALKRRIFAVKEASPDMKKAS